MDRRILLVTALLLLLTACTAGRAPARKALPPAPPAVTLRVGACENGDERQFLDMLVAAYQDVHKDTRIQVSYVPCGDKQSLIKLVYSDQYHLVSANYFTNQSIPYVDLRPYMARAGITADAFGGMLAERTVNGDVNALPLRVVPVVIWANKPLFDQAGIPLPDASWDWAEFRAVAARLGAQRTDGKRTALPLEAPEVLVRYWIEERTGRPFIEADDQTLKEALTFFRTLVLEDRTLDKPEPRDWNGVINCCDMTEFDAGRAPLTVRELPSIPTLPNMLATSNIAVLPIPTQSGQRTVTEARKSWYGILKKSPRPDAAFDFLTFAAGPQGALATAKAGYLPAAPTDAVAKVWADWNPPLPPTLQVLVRSRFCADLYQAKEGELRRVALGMFNQVLRGSTSVDDAVTAYSQRADAIRKR